MRITLRDIAKKLNLSHATVSFVINDRRDISIPETTRKRVLDAVKDMGYRPNRVARALAVGRSDMVSVWTPAPHAEFYSGYLKEMARLAAAHDLDLVARIADFNTERVERQDVSDWPVDGVFVIDCADAPLMGLTLDSDRPVVSIGAFYSEDVDHVGIDIAGAHAEAFEHLLEMGARHISYVSLMRRDDGFDSRKETYLECCKNFGVVPESIISVDPSPAGVRSTIRRSIEERGCPDAMMVFNDTNAMVAIRALHDAGISVPERCKVVGCDGVPSAEYHVPSLTTVSQPIVEACNIGWGFAETRIQNPLHPLQSRVLPCRLVVRESTFSSP